MNLPPRQPDEWDWSGVWKERVQKGINTSTSDSILYGSAGSGDDIVCCLYIYFDELTRY